jgi:hypothetical protein
MNAHNSLSESWYSKVVDISIFIFDILLLAPPEYIQAEVHYHVTVTTTYRQWVVVIGIS